MDEPKRFSILLAEDEPLVRDLIVFALQRAGHDVLSAPNGEEALELSRQYPGCIDLLITDIIMPRMSGVELYESITREHPQIRVLAISGKTAGESIAEHQGFDFLHKPFLPRVLTEKVRQILGG